MTSRAWTVRLACVVLLAGCYPDWPADLLRADTGQTDLGQVDLATDATKDTDGDTKDVGLDAKDSGADAKDVGPSDVTPPCSDLSCPLGCNVGSNRCNRLAPSNFDPTGFFDQVSAGVTGVTGSIVLDTDTGQIKADVNIIRPAGGAGTVQNGIYWGTVLQGGTGYPTLSVFGMTSLKIPTGATLQIVGGKALALYVTGDVIIDGSVTAPPGARSRGPAGSPAATRTEATPHPATAARARVGPSRAA